MSLLTLRLPDMIEAQLAFFAQREQTTKSALGRLALEAFIAQKQRELELEAMFQAVNIMKSTPAALSEMEAMNQDFDATDVEAQQALQLAESSGTWWK